MLNFIRWIEIGDRNIPLFLMGSTEMSLQDIINIVFIILQIAYALIIPTIIWMMKSIMEHSTQIALIQKEVNQSFPEKIQKIEHSITSIQYKMDDLTKDSIWTKGKIENIESLIENNSNILTDIKRYIERG